MSEKVPELYELLEDIVELGGWVEPDVPWPKLVYLQVNHSSHLLPSSLIVKKYFNK